MCNKNVLKRVTETELVISQSIYAPASGAFANNSCFSQQKGRASITTATFASIHTHMCVCYVQHATFATNKNEIVIQMSGNVCLFAVLLAFAYFLTIFHISNSHPQQIELLFFDFFPPFLLFFGSFPYIWCNCSALTGRQGDQHSLFLLSFSPSLPICIQILVCQLKAASQRHFSTNSGIFPNF